MEKNKVGLALGSFFAVIHLVWALFVAITPNALQKFFDWIFNLHGIAPIIAITSMTLMKALTLIVVAFIFGYIIGWVFAWLFGCCDCCIKPKKRR
jgi:hypothetical protein